MVSSFDPLTAPAVMPREVARTTEKGFPTQAMLDWEQQFKGWTVSQTVRFNEQVTELHDDFNGISADGQVQFQAITTPGGAVAAFGIYLKTTGSLTPSFTGMSMIAMSDGTSTIAFDAKDFRFNDSGKAKNVFSYDSDNGVFSFNVPVSIENGNLENSAVTRAWPATGGTSTSVAVDFRGTGFMEIYAQFMGDANIYSAIDQFVLRVYEDGNPIGDTPITQNQNGTGVTAATRYGATSIVYIRTPSSGAHTYSAEIIKTVSATSLMISGVLIVVKEYSK